MKNKKLLKELASICKLLAKSSENVEARKEKIVKKKCTCCGNVKKVVKFGKVQKKDYSGMFLKKAKVFEALAMED